MSPWLFDSKYFDGRLASNESPAHPLYQLTVTQKIKVKKEKRKKWRDVSASSSRTDKVGKGLLA
jgi:hypothetical protein